MHQHHVHILIMAFISLIPGVHSAATVEQMFPRAEYCCHCPNIRLQCTFSRVPLVASWTVLVNGTPEQVTNNTVGHTVDISKLNNMILILHVNDTQYSRGNMYSCTAVYSASDNEVSDLFSIPEAEDITAPIRDLTITPSVDTLIVKWDHEYHLCRNFTVYLNDEAVPECTDIKIMNCTIGNLEAGVTYKVTVNATETGTEPITISRLISTMAVDSGICHKITGICIWLPILLVIVCGLLAGFICLMIYCIKRLKKGSKGQPMELDEPALKSTERQVVNLKLDEPVFIRTEKVNCKPCPGKS